MDEFINISKKAEERSIWFKFRLKNARIKKLQDSHNPESALKFTADPRSIVFSKFANPLDLLLKLIHNPCAFHKAKSVDSKTYSPPLIPSTNVETNVERSLKPISIPYYYYYYYFFFLLAFLLLPYLHHIQYDTYITYITYVNQDTPITLLTLRYITVLNTTLAKTYLQNIFIFV